MTTSTHPSQRHIPRPNPCQHIVDNGNGIVWYCSHSEHPSDPDGHFMVADELRARREGVKIEDATARV